MDDFRRRLQRTWAGLGARDRGYLTLGGVLALITAVCVSGPCVENLRKADPANDARVTVVVTRRTPTPVRVIRTVVPFVAARTPTPASDPSRNCSSSYPGVCIPPAPPNLDCGDISFRRFAVRGADPHGFDNDGDGVGCESG